MNFGTSTLAICGAVAGTTLAASAQTLTAPSGWTPGASGSTQVWTRGQSKLKLSAPVPAANTRAFFDAQVARDASYRGAVRSKGAVKATANGGYSAIYTFANGVVAYGAFRRSDGARFLALSAPNFAALKRDLPALQNIATQLQHSRAPQPRPTSAVNKSQMAPAKTSYQGVLGHKYLSESQIVGIYLDENYTSGVGGMPVLEYDAVMLLRDGTAYEDFEVPPTELNLASFKKARPSRVGKWKRTAKGFSVLFNGDKTASEIKASFKVKPASAGQKLAGSYETIGGGGNTALGGDVMVAYSNSYTFAPNGRFSGDRSGGGNAPGVAVSSTSKNAGTYSVSGYTLILKYNGGQTVRKLFYFYPDKDSASKPVIGIGDSAYVPQ